MLKQAYISAEGYYRYTLFRCWRIGKPSLVFIMLNPSTADEQADDNTIKKCVGIAERLGFGSIWVGNLFAFRATKPERMMEAKDPVGPENWHYITDMCLRGARENGLVICGWGTHGGYLEADKKFKNWLLDKKIPSFALAASAQGHPKHPLFSNYPKREELIKFPT